MRSLQQKVVVITGAASGIGRSLALRCARYGAHLALCDIDAAGLASLKAEVERFNVRVLTAQVDVSDGREMKSFAARVIEQLGGADVVVNNAGVSLSETVERMDRKDFEWLFGINFWGTVNGCNAFLPQLRTKSEGSLVNISSVFGLIAMPGQSAYSAAKFAVRGFTEALRSELSDTKIAVTVVHPGGVRTNIVRNGRHYTDVAGEKVEAATMAKNFEKVARTSPESAAASIVEAILAGKRRLLIGPDAYIMDWLQRLTPAYAGRIASVLSRMVVSQARRKQGAPAVENADEVERKNFKQPPIAS